PIQRPPRSPLFPSTTLFRSDASGCPGPSCQHERCCRQQLAAAFAQLSLPACVETGRVIAGRPHSECERLPPLLEARMLDLDGKKDRKSTRLNSSHVAISYAV